jgi:hypothetical protein
VKLEAIAGHPSQQDGGQENNNWKKWRAEEEERHKRSLTQKTGKISKTFPKS